MPELAQRNDDCQFSSDTTSLRCFNGSVYADEFWSKCRGDVSYNQLQKFWSELSRQARRELLRIEKQTLFEQARKNMYCSRCNGLLLEGFMQIVMYGKSSQQENAVGHLPCNRLGISKFQNDGDFTNGTGCQGEVQDPSVHPWGGLTTTRDGTLTLLDCYLFSTSLKGIQNVFDSARARERERELLYPDACGGGGRGWISQGMASYGRGHGTRETCALHTARLSVDTLVDFWSALGEETRQSLLKMKEEDFIERLMYRFDSKRFCRDCRRNVIREFKELKELKRIRREPRCTSWFCVADTSFQYEVTHDMVQADWRRTFIDTFGTYHHFEWAIGSGEGKSDILEFKNVGLSGRVQVKGLNLGCLNACYITLRAWKIDGSCTEFSVKAHALKGKQCVHCRLVVGDGFVTITRGESIRSFFEHAEEAEEEEDDDSMDKDGNELDGECSRPQKHAKSPELAREFLLDAATVIFKEQVEKAFREGTARQNAHSIFVSLALKLLEERIHVACKEILTLEKQTKLLQEEEKEKHEEEERKERRRMKEREKKLRKKERLREKEKDREKKYSPMDQHVAPDIKIEEPTIIDEPKATDNESLIIKETGEIMSSRPVSPDIEDEQLINGFIGENMQNLFDENGSIEIDYSKNSCRNLKYPYEQDTTSKLSHTVPECGGMVSEQNYNDDHFINASRTTAGLNMQPGSNAAKSNPRTCGPKICEKLHCSNRIADRYDSHACSCYQHNDYRGKVESYYSRTRVGRESAFDMSKPYYSRNKFNQEEYIRDSVGRPKTKFAAGTNPYSRNSPHIKQVWEPMESQKKYARSNSESDVTLRSSSFVADASEPNKSLEFHGAVTYDVRNEKNIGIGITVEDNEIKEFQLSKPGMKKNCQNGFSCKEGNCQCSKLDVDQEAEMSNSLIVIAGPSISSTSSSGSCSSCISEGDSSGASSHPQIIGSSSTSSDSEDASQQSEGIETSQFLQNAANEFEEIVMDKKQIAKGSEASRNGSPEIPAPANVPKQVAQLHDNGNPVFTGMNLQAQDRPPLYSQSFQFPVLQTSTMGYYHQSPVSWPTAPVNGLMSLPHPNNYLYPSPFRYGVNGNSHFMQYGSVQHLASPLRNPAQVPVYQPIIQTNDINLKEHAVISDLVEIKETHCRANLQPEILAGRDHIRTQHNAAGEQNENSHKSQIGNADFSLFHFGGPVALANEYKSDSLPPKEVVGDLSSIKPINHIEGNHACNKKDSVEEYNLFAASKGIRFSIF